MMLLRNFSTEVQKKEKLSQKRNHVKKRKRRRNEKTKTQRYFKTKTSGDSTRHGKRKVTAEYIVWTAKQYKIKSIIFPEDSSVLAKSIAQTRKRTLLVPGKPYDLDVIKKERERIDAR